ncbi:hypothetical protein REPUB_Repub02eG0233900 [Reevesia pubescens]
MLILSESVWLSASPSIGDGDPESEPGTLEIFSMSDTWTGSIWVRTKCSFEATMTNFTCETGDCGSGSMDCQFPPPKPPVTLLNFGINQNVVSYEVNLNHGFNIPVRIQPISGSLVGGSGLCPIVDCIKDLKDVCPSPLAAQNRNGVYIGRNSPFDALKDPKYCCTGGFTGWACQPNAYSKTFKQLVPLPGNFFSFLTIQALPQLSPMAKKKQKIKELNQIDNVPKFTKLPRKAASKAKRSSSSSSSSPSAPGSLAKCSYDRDEASSATLTNFDDIKDGRKKVHDSVHCSQSRDKRPGFVLNFYESPAVEVESVALNKVSDPCSGRIVQKVVEEESDKKTLQVRGSNGVCITPGNAVWAKTACQVWWPAEIIGKKSSLADSRIQQTEKHVLVKFYGKHNSAWVNATRDLSMLEDCFEERSCNTMENFQDSLKQALAQRKEHIKSCRQLPGSPDSSTHSDQLDRKSGKRTSSTSSKTGSNVVKQGGSKKERKPTIHLNDATFPLKSGKGGRKLKIMRHLGLTAPVGSPF